MLPKYYKHRNFTSLVRQLNMYGFHKVVGVDQGGLKGHSDQVWEFIHPYVHRDHPQLLVHVRRKDAAAAASKSKGKNDVSNLVSELHTMRYEHSVIADKFLEMEQQNRALWQEVDHLKKQNTEQQWKIHKILQFIAQVFNRDVMPNPKRTRYLEDNTERANAIELPAELSEFDLAEPLLADPRIGEVFADLPATSASSSMPATSTAIPPVSAPISIPMATPSLLSDPPLLPHPAAAAVTLAPSSELAAGLDGGASSSKLLRLHSIQDPSELLMGQEIDGLEKRLESTRPRLASAGLDHTTISSLFNSPHDPVAMNSSLHSFLEIPELGLPVTSLPSDFPPVAPSVGSPSPRAKRTLPA